MLLTNLSKRLITINAPLVHGQRSEFYRVKCGTDNTCEVPDNLCDNAFVKGLIDSGDLTASKQIEVAEDVNDQFADMSKPQLTDYAEAMDITVKSAWNMNDIIEAIKAVQQ